MYRQQQRQNFRGMMLHPAVQSLKMGTWGEGGGSKMITSFMDDHKLKQDDEHNIVISINWPPFTMTNEY